MRRLVSLAVLLFFTVPFGMSIAGCSKAVNVHYCSGGDSGPSAGQVAEITLSPTLATYGESLNYGQIGQSLSASAVDCFGASAAVRSYTYATTNMSFADINPATGQVCAGTWNRNVGGGVPNYSTCTPPATPPGQYLAYVTATANGAVSNAIPVYIHPVATSVSIGSPSGSCLVGTQAVTGSTTNGSTLVTVSSTNLVAAGLGISGLGIPANSIITAVATNAVTISNSATATASGSSLTIIGNPTSNCCPLTATAPGNPPPYTGQSCVSQGQTAQLVASVYENGDTYPADNITCQVGHLSFSARTAPNVVTIDENGVATAEQPGSTTITSIISSSGSGSTAGFFSTCPPASITLSVPGQPANTSSITVPLNNTQPITTTVIDTNGNPITGLLLEYNSTDQQIIPTSGNSITPPFPGTANITAVCQPPTCNTAPFSQINYLGNGTALTSGGLQITTPGASATVLYTGSTNSQYLYPFDFTTNQPGELVKLPYVPNSMVISQTGTAIYLGSSQALMTVTTAANAVTANVAVVGKVLAISPAGNLLVVTDPVRQTVSIIGTTGTTVATYGGVGTNAIWSPDGQTVYITTTTKQLLVHTGLTGWSAEPTDEIYTGVAVTVPHIGAYFAAAPSANSPATPAATFTEARSYCPASTLLPSINTNIPTVSNTFYPVAQTAAVSNDVVSATDDGAHMLGATAFTTPATLNDLSLALPITTPCPPVTPSITTAQPPQFNSTNRQFPLLGVAATSITGVVAAENSALAFVTYIGSSTNPAGQLPQYVPGAGALSFVPLSGTATAPVAGVFSSDNLSFYAGTTGDNKVHLITINYASPTAPTATDSQEPLTPNLPVYNGTGIATPNLLVQRPKKATS